VDDCGSSGRVSCSEVDEITIIITKFNFGIKYTFYFILGSY
jgi:hypothetical protein